ncbi:hypothetical protein BEWA_050450 [Theileria equi strain WA]|uniref:Uncharacterized protein n=1 Tax=Theileria equi strain WA TaxID=1537102 RepID=L1LAT5_THEEQ|nr:hypothetical protein BEWA_050450 [Theileria equi strain WA]EKX72577.1 hypothetical protein BEWA_050450 [Theileria equi strain WA]|eukprot:XP_004832029.1 hypothetical protein BEWA_050450 [Theileria equi strain WA]
MTKELVLDISAGCGESGTCNCKVHPDGITATREVNKPVAGFIKLIHKSNIPFKLNKDLGGLSIIEVGGNRKDSYIQNVQSVSVYYWNGSPDTPILLGITKGSSKPTFYGRAIGFKTWMNGRVQNLDETQALDNQNCHNNDAVPFNIQDSTSGDLLKESKSSCLNKYRKIKLAQSSNPPGSEYVTTAYNIPSNTKISRVTYNGKPTDIPHISDPVDVITLYSYPGSDSVPLMIEFLKQGGASRWFESKDSGGTSWTEVGSGGNFYGTDSTIPKSALSEKLDEVLCKQYGNVTLDLSSTRSNRLEKYCCNEHQKNGGRIAVTKGEIKVNGVSKTASYYKHSLAPGTSVAGVYYKDIRGNRKKITLSGSPFPISGIQSVYTFYCGEEKPSLIYVDSDSVMTKGWYKGTDENWIWTHTGLEPKDFENKELDCMKWMKFKIKLGDCGCTGLSDCSIASGKSLEKLKEELQQEEKREREKREKLIAAEIRKVKQSAAQGFSSSTLNFTDSSDNSGSNGEDNSGGFGSVSITSSQLSPKGSSGSSTPVVSNSGAGGVTVRLDSRRSYPINHREGKMIDVSLYNNTLIAGYSAFQHKRKGKDFTINKFTVGNEGQTFPKEAIPVKDVKSVIVYFLSCSKSDDPATNIPLLVYIGSNDGKRHHWYIMKEKNGRKLYDISYVLWNRPPHKAKNLQITLQNIAEYLGISCKKESVPIPPNNDNEIKDQGTNGIPNNNIVQSGEMSNAISLGLPPKKLPILQLKAQQGGDNFYIVEDQKTVENTVKSEYVPLPSAKPDIRQNSVSSDLATNIAQGEATQPICDERQVSSATLGTASTSDGDGKAEESDSQTPLDTTPAEPGKTERFASVLTGGILAGAGYFFAGTAGTGATFFGGWKLYNRYKGDPWVRQI